MGNDNPNIYQYDNIDILLETQVHTYYQLTITPLGELLDMDRSNGLRTEWTANATLATHIGDGYWSAELRLPAAGDEAGDLNPLVGIAGHTPSSTYPWYINILRQAFDNGEVELSALNPTGGKFHTPEKMAKVFNT